MLGFILYLCLTINLIDVNCPVNNFEFINLRPYYNFTFISVSFGFLQYFFFFLVFTIPTYFMILMTFYWYIAIVINISFHFFAGIVKKYSSVSCISLWPCILCISYNHIKFTYQGFFFFFFFFTLYKYPLSLFFF